MPFPTVASPPTPFPTYLVPSLPFRRRKSSTSTISIIASSSASPPSGIAGAGATSYFPASFSSSSPPPTDQLEESYLTTHTSHLRCSRCAADLALSNQIISKGFTGRHGRAYLVSASSSSGPGSSSSLHAGSDPSTIAARNAALPNLPNTHVHRPVPRTLVTGAHTVGDISCAHCGSVLGWKYVGAEEEAQRYKVGKFILETKKVSRCSTWEGETAEELFVLEEEDDILQEELGGVPVGSSAAQSRPMRRRRASSLAIPPDAMPKARGEEDLIEFDSQDEDECDDLFLGVWTPQLAARRRKTKKSTRI